MSTSSAPPDAVAVATTLTVAFFGYYVIRDTIGPFRLRMRIAIPVSIALGIVWNVVALSLMGGRVVDAFVPSWLLAGAFAGVAAGVFTIWSRRRRDGRESVLYGIANYYVGIFVYWVSFVVIQRAIMCVQHGGWTDFDLRDHLGLIVIFLIYGTFGSESFSFLCVFFPDMCSGRFTFETRPNPVVGRRRNE